MSGTRGTLTFFACALVFASAPPPSAQAQSPSQDGASVEQAKTLFDAGAQAYSAGQYLAAVQAFEQAYRLAPRPPILFSIAQAERKEYFVSKKGEHLQRAISYYREYLAKVTTGGRRADAADALAELEPLASKLDLDATGKPAPQKAEAAPTRLMVSSQTPGAHVALDGAGDGDAPLIEEVQAGKHRVRVSAPGFLPEEREVTSLQGTLVAVDVTLREKPASVSVDCEDGADVYVDGRFAGTTPLPRPLELASGERVFSVTKAGTKGKTMSFTVERGQTSRVVVKLERTGQRTASFIVFASGLATLVASGVFIGVSLSYESTATHIANQERAGNISSADLAQYGSAASARDDWRTAGITALGVSAGLMGVGAALYFFDKPSVPTPTAQGPERMPSPAPALSPKDISMTPTVRPDGFGLGLRGAF